MKPLTAAKIGIVIGRLNGLAEASDRVNGQEVVMCKPDGLRGLAEELVKALNEDDEEPATK